MEHVVNFHQWGEIQAIGDHSDLFFDCEGSILFGQEFTCPFDVEVFAF